MYIHRSLVFGHEKSQCSNRLNEGLNPCSSCYKASTLHVDEKVCVKHNTGEEEEGLPGLGVLMKAYHVKRERLFDLALNKATQDHT